MRSYPVNSFSTCNTAKLDVLDFDNWFQDNSGLLNPHGNCYIHVKHKDGDTSHRVHPRGMKGKEVRRLAMEGGTLCWLYDNITKG